MSDKQRTHAARGIIESNPLAEAVALAKEKKSKVISCRIRPTVYELVKQRCKEDKIAVNDCIDQLLFLYGNGDIDLIQSARTNRG